MIQTIAALREDIEICELENRNLRTALAAALSLLPDITKDEIEKKLDLSLDDGGVTGTTAEEERQEVVQLLCAITEHTERLIHAQRIIDVKGTPFAQSWYGRLDHLLTQARQYQPKHPAMVRVGGHPNVFAPVRRRV